MHLPIIEPMFSNTDNQADNQANKQEAQSPSLADIVREETDDGRVIVRFLIDVMQGQLENSKPCHRLDAARQLLTLGFHPAQSFIDANTHASPTRKNSAPSALSAVNPSPLHQELAAIIREETDNGRTTVRFLVDVMQGQLENSKPCHRLDAARQLLTLGFHPAQSFIDANTHASPTRKNSAPSALSAVNPSPLHQELAAIIREETDNGRTTVRFLVDVMQGTMPDFKPHHRLSAAKELLRRGFDTPTPAGAGNSTAMESHPEQSAPAEKPPRRPTTGSVS